MCGQNFSRLDASRVQSRQLLVLCLPSHHHDSRIYACPWSREGPLPPPSPPAAPPPPASAIILNYSFWLRLHILYSHECNPPPVQVLPYSQLQSAVSISGVRELEDFLINHCFYAGVITAGKLDQKQACLQVGALGRGGSGARGRGRLGFGGRGGRAGGLRATESEAASHAGRGLRGAWWQGRNDA